MNKRIVLVLLAMVLVVSLAAFVACAAEEEAPPVTEGWQWPDQLMLGTAGVGDQNYVVTIAWSTPLDKDIPEMTVRVVVQPDMQLRYIWLKTGIIDACSLKQSGMPWIETEKEQAGRDGGPSRLRGLLVSGKRDLGWATTPGTGLKTPYDIKPGTRIIWAAYLGPPEDSQLGLIAWAQVDQEDIVWVPGASKAATYRLLMDGKGDVMLADSTTRAAWYEAEAAPRGLSWLDLDAKADPEGAARYLAVKPDTTFAVTTDGVPSSLGHYGMTTMGPLLVMADKDPELIYHLGKWLDEKHDLYKDNHPVTAGMTIDNAMILAETHYIPYHEGMVRYFKELGVWTPAAEARLQYNIDLIDEYVEAWNAALLEADEKGIEVNPKNKEWVELWYGHRDQLPKLHKGKVELSSE